MFNNSQERSTQPPAKKEKTNYNNQSEVDNRKKKLLRTLNIKVSEHKKRNKNE